MKITEHTRGSYRVIVIVDRLGITADLSPLRTRVQEAIAEGHKSVAIALTPDSFLSSRSLSVLLMSSDHVRDAGGEFVIIAPGADLRRFMAVTELGTYARICDSEDEL